MNIHALIAEHLNVRETQVLAAVELLDEGATVPFIARYRKEKTGGLDDTQLRELLLRLQYLRELEARKAVILKSIAEQNKLTEALQAQIEACDHKTALEDLYLPYKPKRRTKAQIAREQGLQALAEALLAQDGRAAEVLAADFINEHVADTASALDGARAIILEYFAEDSVILGTLRSKLWQEAELQSQVVEGKEETGEKFKDYYDYREALHRVPSHRALAMFRGRQEEVLQLRLLYPQQEGGSNDYEALLQSHFHIKPESAFLLQCVRLAWRAKLFLSLELDALKRLREEAEEEAIKVFARNLKDLLLAAPAGRLRVLGLDPGFRTGIKCAAVSDTGTLLATSVVYLHQERQALAELSQLIKQYQIQCLAIGNGTASRETEQLVRPLLQAFPDLQKITVSEAGASVYSASALAAAEFPDLDVSYRGAVSIARRLQDPLAELVKIEPKAIGVGQYQHDVNQSALAQALDGVVEDCVNAVGVDVNTASSALLTRISGLNSSLAHNIVQYRDQFGAFPNRKALLKVPRLGAKTFEQAAGFLRILDGDEVLDRSAVHPEAYDLVEKMAAKQALPTADLIANTEVIKNIRAHDFVDERFGLPTILDILQELEKPNRDPRGTFKTAQWKEGVNEIKDLQIGMILEGTVTNVANFGAFVDIGVHQDGLVHVSMLANRFVRDPHEVVKAGDIVRVRVVEVDEKRKRIALSMRDADEDKSKVTQHGKRQGVKHETVNKQTQMAAAFADLRKK